MQTLRNLLLYVVISAAGSWGAQRLTVHQVQLVGPMGTDTGHLIATSNELLFVNDVNPNLSFSMPRSDITRLSLANGIVTINMNQPFIDLYGNRADTILRFQTPSDAERFANWAGIPMSGLTVVTGGRSRIESLPGIETQFDVIHDDDHGRLVISPNTIGWQNLKNTSKSRNWSYSDIKEFKRENSNELKLKTYSGQEFKFKAQGAAMTDDVYAMIADRIVAAHR